MVPPVHEACPSPRQTDSGCPLLYSMVSPGRHPSAPGGQATFMPFGSRSWKDGSPSVPRACKRKVSRDKRILRSVWWQLWRRLWGVEWRGGVRGDPMGRQRIEQNASERCAVQTTANTNQNQGARLESPLSNPAPPPWCDFHPAQGYGLLPGTQARAWLHHTCRGAAHHSDVHARCAFVTLRPLPRTMVCRNHSPPTTAPGIHCPSMASALLTCLTPMASNPVCSSYTTLALHSCCRRSNPSADPHPTPLLGHMVSTIHLQPVVTLHL